MPTELRRKDVKSLVQQGRAQLVDVLPAREFKREHLPGAINLPLSDLNAESARQLRRDIAIIVYGAEQSCDLSARAAWRLESMGFQEVYRYTAGKTDWIAGGLDTEGTDANKPRLKQLLRKNVMTCTSRDRLGALKNRRGHANDLCVVLNDRNIVLGAISGEAWQKNPLMTAGEAMDPAPLTFRPSMDRTEALRDLRKLDLKQVLITTSDGELLGVVSRSQRTNHKGDHVETDRPAPVSRAS